MMIIAISGQPGAGTSTIARRLAKKLGLDYFSPGKFFKKHSKLKKQTREALDVWQTETGKSKFFHEKIDDMQREKARKGNVVVCGKLSIHALKDIADKKIWIDCSLDERARRTAKRDGISLDEAKKSIRKREDIERKEWKRIYGFDRSTQKNMADIIIDTTNLTVEQTLNMILRKLHNL